MARELSDEEQRQWAVVTKTVSPIDCPSGAAGRGMRAFVPPPPSWSLDLHDTTLENAYRAVLDLIDEAIAFGASKLTVITGKSGQIRREFPVWAERFPIRDIEILNGGGAFVLHLAKGRSF